MFSLSRFFWSVENDAVRCLKLCNAIANNNSVRGFEVIDAIKNQVDAAACKATVSRADIYLGHNSTTCSHLGQRPNWQVVLGRRDARTTSQNADDELPRPSSSSLCLSALISMFASKGLSPQDMTALSGAHTVALAQCFTFRDRPYQDSNMDANLAALRKQSCPPFGGDSNLAPPDLQSPYRFGNDYHQNPLSPWAPPLPPGALQRCLVGCLGLGVHHQRRRTL
ncbi:unnamed protein product [Musa acuminata var. zebrina]